MPPGLARGAGNVDTLAIRWPSGQVDKLKNIAANQQIFVKESHGIIRTMQFGKNCNTPK